jgi:hypothetical protein
LEKPGSSKNKKQEIFGDFYNEIFDQNKIDADYILLPYLLYRKIENDIKNFKKKIKELEKNKESRKLNNLINKDGFLNHALYYLLFTLKLLAEKNGISLESRNTNQIFKFYNKAKQVIRKIVKEKKKDPAFSMPHLFKSDDLVKEIKYSLKY